MDPTHIGVVATSLGMAKDIAKAMIGIRDFNLVAEKLSALNEQLLKAQDALLAHNAAMFQLQSENFEAREQLRKLNESIAERDRYTLFEIAPGNLVYRVNVPPATSATDTPVSPEPMHYLCQPCYDKGVKAVLGREGGDGYGSTVQRCPVCRRGITVDPGPRVDINYRRNFNPLA